MIETRVVSRTYYVSAADADDAYDAALSGDTVREEGGDSPADYEVQDREAVSAPELCTDGEG